MNQNQVHTTSRVTREFVPSEATLKVFGRAYSSKRLWGEGYSWFAYLFNWMSGSCLDRGLAEEALCSVVNLSLPEFAYRRFRALSAEDKVMASDTEDGLRVVRITISNPREQLLLRAMMMKFIVARMERPVWKQVVDLLLGGVYQQLTLNNLYLDAGVARLCQGTLEITVLVEDC